LNGVTYGNGLFVAVSGNAWFFESPDGTTWTGSSLRNFPRNNFGNTQDFFKGTYEDITYGNGLFVVVGGEEGIFRDNGIILTSTGTNSIWTERVLQMDGYAIADSGVLKEILHGITYGNGLFVAVGRGGIVLTSPDGKTWTKRTTGTTDLFGVTYGNGLFVVVGSAGIFLTSPDGNTWTERTFDNLILSKVEDTQSLYGVTYGNGLFVAVGGSGKLPSDDGIILTSPDGTTWTERTSGPSWRIRNLNGVTYRNGLFVAAGGADILTSPDGASWTKLPPRDSSSGRIIKGVILNGIR
jgi:hypothetical protein